MARTTTEKSTLEVRIVADTSSFKNGMREATVQAKSQSKKTSQVMGGLKKKAAAAGAAAASAFVTGFAKLTAKTAKAAMSAQKSSAQLKTVFQGNIEEAEKFKKTISDFASVTPYDTKTLVDASSKLIRIGTDAADVIPIMTTLGDSVASIGGEAKHIDRAVYALTQMQMTGKITSVDMMQLINAGVPAWSLLAEEIGTTEAAAKKMVQEGVVPAEKMFDALGKTGQESMKSITGAMEEQSKTLAGRIETAKDLMKRSFSAAGKPMIEPLGRALDAIGVIVSQFVDAMAPAMQNLVNWIAPFLEAIAPALKQFGNILATLIIPITNIFMGLLTTLGPVLINVATIIVGHFAESMRAIEPLILALANTLALLLPAFLPILDIVNQFGLTIFQLLIPPITELLLLLNDWLARVMPGVIEWTTKLTDKMKAMAPQWEVWGAKIANLVNLMITDWEGFKDELGRIWDEVWAKLKEIWNDKILPWMKDTGKDLIEWLWEGIKDMADWFKRKFKDWIKDAITAPFEAAWNKVTGIFGGGDDKGKSASAAMFTPVGPAMPTTTLMGVGAYATAPTTAAASMSMRPGTAPVTPGVLPSATGTGQVVIHQTINATDVDPYVLGRVVVNEAAYALRTSGR